MASAWPAAIWLLADGFADDWLAGLETLLLFVSIAVAWWDGVGVRAARRWTHAVLDAAPRVAVWIRHFVLYHSSNAVSLALFYLLAVTTSIASLLYSSFLSQKRWVGWVDLLTAAALVSVMSIQMLLTLATLGAVAGFEGAAMESDDETWADYATRWSIQHSISFFFAAALVGSRYEHHVSDLSTWWMRGLWAAGPVVCLLLWIVGMAVAEGSPYEGMTDTAVTVLGVLCSLVPWVFVGFVLC